MMAGHHKSPEYLTKQPFGQVPYLDDDGFIVYESRAIGRYIARKYADKGPKLIPDVSNIQEWAIFEQIASVEQANYDPYVSGITAQRVFNPMKGVPIDEERVKQLYDTFVVKLDGYERILSKSKYLTGDELSAVDLFHLPYGRLAEKQFSEFFAESRPNVHRWWKDISSLPSWQRVEREAAEALAALKK